ncbi:galaxin-like isoform X1 [Haliotis rufescens]|uniref:galaxin-like isoform X1 n=1 Tax=Haliotis rufescens TaxID=6454 RepID=UPI001EAF97A0|nr:galaxin-like isoform X1 [Haliotis rufescens]
MLDVSDVTTFHYFDSQVMWIYIALCAAVMAPRVDGEKIYECFVDGQFVRTPAGHFCCNHRLVREGDKGCCYGHDTRVFYTRYNICCDGRVMSRYIMESGGEVERTCCGNRAILLNNSTCCNNTVAEYPKAANPGDMQCCGGQLVNRHTTLCCYAEDNPSQVTKHVSGPNFQCCGIKVIDQRLQQCNRMNGKEVAVDLQEQVCGGRVISLRTHKCCLDRVHNVPHLNPWNIGQENPDVQCCGRAVYNISTQTCCPGTGLAGNVVERTEHLACCGAGSVDTRHQLCCKGHAVAKTSPQDQCCGPKVFNPYMHSCCDDITPFNTLTHYCCTGSPSQPLRKGQDCCSTLKSCSHYTGDTEMRTSPRDTVCEGVRFLPELAVCCNSQVHYFPPGDTLGCCRRWDLKQTVYSETTQMCCQGHVHNESANEAECCSTQAYHLYSGHNPCLVCVPGDVLPPHQMCCANQTYDKRYDGDACCGHVPYFSHEETCCNGQVQDGDSSCQYTQQPGAQISSACSYGFPSVPLMVAVVLLFMNSRLASL